MTKTELKELHEQMRLHTKCVQKELKLMEEVEQLKSKLEIVKIGLNKIVACACHCRTEEIAREILERIEE